jgi:hypothetical protein
MPDARFVTALPERIAYGLLILLALTFPFDTTLWASAVADASWSSVRLEVVALLSVWLVALVAARRRPRSPPAGIMAAGVASLGVLLVSAIMAPSHGTDALKSWARVASGLALGYAAFDLTRAYARRRTVVVALAVAGIAVALLGLAEAVGVQYVDALTTKVEHQPQHPADVQQTPQSEVNDWHAKRLELRHPRVPTTAAHLHDANVEATLAQPASKGHKHPLSTAPGQPVDHQRYARLVRDGLRCDRPSHAGVACSRRDDVSTQHGASLRLRVRKLLNTPALQPTCTVPNAAVMAMVMCGVGIRARPPRRRTA